MPLKENSTVADSHRRPQHASRSTLTLSIAAMLPLLAAPGISAGSTAALERRIAELEAELDRAREALIEAKEETEQAYEQAAAAEQQLADTGPPPADKITLGPLTIGGAIRANYTLGSYPGEGKSGAYPNIGPSRGGDGGNFALDTFRINMDLSYDNIVGKLEYRWYPGYNFLHTGWLGWNFDDGSQVQVGVNRVPFGPGAYGVSQSWFFDQHYYVGLADDMDLGIKYITSIGDWDLDFAYYNRSQWDGNGKSQDSARYDYDAVLWTGSVAADGSVGYNGTPNGYKERNQFNVRAIYNLDEIAIPTELGTSLQWGQLKGRGTDDGHHWAASVHMKNSWDNWLVATQLTRYKYSIDGDNAWNSDQLIPMGAFDFPWPVATDAWIPAISVSYLYETNQIPWLDSVRPYAEYSNIVKQDSNFNDSQLVTLGAAWARGGWYIYTDLAFSDGNYFVGSETSAGTAETYTNLFSPINGAGDFGVNANDHWNYRFNINFGYYF
ncbi:hypothetical protein [uncultured Thiohalocapsa sp.]|uniref:hypothetical protein n=1 Tax=uncultured Thiohalocapsa sp. TaxID=768990 RepID=UPI0025EE3BAE|nr:hypothetical protein [uncultured Thiohalocapsa sp.]